LTCPAEQYSTQSAVQNLDCSPEKMKKKKKKIAEEKTEREETL
jgi:hypothetical protein